MEFVNSFLDLERWIMLIKALVVPITTLADFLFDDLPKIFIMANDVLVVAVEFADLGIDFLRQFLNISLEIIQSGFFNVVSASLSAILDILNAWKPIILSFSSLLVKVINTIGRFFVQIINVVGKFFNPLNWEAQIWNDYSLN